MRTTLAVLVLACGLASGANILVNPSFEVWLDTIGVNMPAGWVTSEVVWPGTAVKDTESHSGEYCILLSGGDTSAFATTATLVQAGRHYELSGYVQTTEVVAGTFAVQFLSIAGRAVGSPELIPAYYSGSSYRNYSRWVTAPESAMFVSVSFATLPNVRARLDDVTLEDTTVLAVFEALPVAVGRAQPRKVLVLNAAGGRRRAGEVLIDPLGRRVFGIPHPGVYFRIDE